MRCLTSLPHFFECCSAECCTKRSTMSPRDEWVTLGEEGRGRTRKTEEEEEEGKKKEEKKEEKMRRH